MKTIIAAAAMAVTATVAAADPVLGIWTSPVSEGKSITVNIVPCDANICGVIHSVSSGGDQGIVGRTMIWGMSAKGGGSYSGGKVWAPDQDRTYNGRMTLSGSSLKIEGCVLGICRGETFTR